MSSDIAHWLKQTQSSQAQGHWDQAVLYAEEGLLHFPQAAPLHAILAQLYQEQHFFTQARLHYEAARAYAPENTAYTLRLIDDYLRTAETANALVYLQDLLSNTLIEPLGCEVLWRLGKTFFMMGKWQDALLAFSEVLTRQLHDPTEGPDAVAAICYILEVLLYKRRYQRAEQLLLQLPRDLQTAQRVQRYRARVAYHGGNFVQAREAWREILSQTFDEEAFGALHFLGPPVMQSEADALKWQEYLAGAAQLFAERPVLAANEGHTLFNPFDFVLTHQLTEQARLEHWGQWYQRHFPEKGSQVAPSVVNPVHIGVVLDGFDMLACAFLLPWLRHYREASPAYQLTVFYLVGDEIPPALMEYAAHLYPLPVQHQAALAVFQWAKVTGLLYASLRGMLYRLAMTPPRGLQQYLYPLYQYASGLPQLSQALVNAQVASALYWHTDPVISSGLTRSALRLPTLGHLYCFAFDPFGWTPEMDLLAEAILQQDRKAFIVGFIHGESTWHLRVQQRLDQVLSRPQRVRWIALDNPVEAIPLMDAVVAVARPESEFMAAQALNQSKRMGYLRHKAQPVTPFAAALAQHAGHYLHEDIFSLANFLTASAGHVRLEHTNFPAPEHQKLAVWDTILLSLEDSL